MSAVTERRRVAADVQEVWDRVTDMAAHGRHVPLTRITRQEELALGGTFVMRTSLGPLGFDDPMTVTGFDPPPAQPARLRLVKSGWLLSGWAEIVVRPVDGGSEVSWTEEAVPTSALLRALSRPADRLSRRATSELLTRILDGTLAGLPALPPVPPHGRG